MMHNLSEWAKESVLFDQVVRYNPLYYGPVRRLLRRVDTMDLEERKNCTQRLLKRALGWAASIQRQKRSTTDLADWPVLEKDDLRGREDRFRNPRILASTDTTSGTSGVPLKLWRSLRCVAAEQAFFDHELAPFGITCRNAKIARLFTEDIKPVSDRKPPFGRLTQGGRRLILSSNHIHPDAIWWYVDRLQEFRPQLLWGMTNALLFLARHMLEQGRRLSIPVVLPTAEVLYPSGRAVLDQAFGGAVLEQFGCAERVFFSTSVQVGQFYFQPAYGHVELKPVRRERAADCRYAEIIATGLWNDAMPLIRYRIQDRIVYPAHYTEDDLREVALGCKPFTAVDGRESEFLISDSGTFLEGMGSIAADVKHVLQAQVVQERLDKVLIRVLPMPGFSEDTGRAMMRKARLKIPDSMQVTIEVVDALEALPSGKIPKVIRRLPDGVTPILQQPPMTAASHAGQSGLERPQGKHAV
jgi:phenylacetate-CoA ligase